MTENGICPVIYTDKIIEESDSLSDAVESVLNTYHNARIIDFDKENMINPDFILENLYIGLQKESNENIFKKQTDYKGIEKYLYVRINNEASFKLTCVLFDTLKINEMETWEAAENNTFSKTQIISMAEILSRMTGQKPEEINGIPKQFIVTNKMNYRGASAILDMESLKNFTQKINHHKFFVLPSSIHEMIIIPDDGTCSIEELNVMVAEINQTQVEPEERLTDRAYVIEV